MNIVNRLTLTHLKMNKRRTLVTIVGAIISVAMITAVVTLPISFLDMMARNTIAREGLWHAAYHDINGKQFASLRQDENTASLAAIREVGFAELETPASSYKPFLYIEQVNNDLFENFHVKLLSGRLPQNENEIVLSSELIKREKLSVGISDQMELSVGIRQRNDSEEAPLSIDAEVVRNEETGEKAEHLGQSKQICYTVVGIMETPVFEYAYQPGYHCLTYLDTDNLRNFDTNSDIDAFAVWSDPKNSMFQSTEELAKAVGLTKDQVHYHYELLRYQGALPAGGTRDAMTGLAAVIMVIIMVGSVSLIYNAFAISVSERYRHLGMLASVGATARQKRHSVFFEGVVIGLISIPIGMLSGLLGIEITFRCISPLLADLTDAEGSLHVVISWGMLAAAAGLSALTILLSVYVPARRAGKIAPIDAIRQSADIKLTKKMVKTSKLTQRLFGVEGVVALKNLKRNRRRYKTTIFSLVISLVLFLSASYFGESFRGANEMSLSGIDFDTYVRFGRNLSEQEIDQMTAKLRTLPGVRSTVDLECYGFAMPVTKDAAGDSVLSDAVLHDPDIVWSGGDAENEIAFGECILVLMGDEELRQYADDAGLSAEETGRLFSAEEGWAIAVNEVTYRDLDQKKFVTKERFPAKKNAQWTLYSEEKTDESASGSSDEAMRFVPVAKLKLAAYTGKVPAGVGENFYDGASPKFIVSQATGKRVAAGNLGISEAAGGDGHAARWHNNRSLYFVSEDPMQLLSDLEALDEQDIYIYSFAEMKRKQDSLILFMNVFLYGFITLITLICIANIFNTISTSIMLRKREFAMLRSVGMTPAGFDRMIRYESIFYGLKALLYGLPLSLGCMLLLYWAYAPGFDFPFVLPVRAVCAAVFAVFVIVFVTMMYASAKVKKENIVESLRQEMI